MTSKITDYDCAAHVAMAGVGYGITAVEFMAAKKAVKYDTHYAFEGHAKPTDDDRALIRTASERLDRNAKGTRS